MSRSFPARRLAVLAALALPLGSAAAQTALTPGHPDLTAAPPQSYEHQIRLAGDTPRLIGRVTQEETISGDRLTIVTRTEVAAQGVDRRDTTVIAWPGLALISRSRVNGEERVRVSVADGRIVGRSVLGNLDEPLDAPFPAGAFGEGLRQRIVRSVPLRAGYTATFQRVDERGNATPATLTVTGPGEAAGTWLVEVATVASEPTQTYTVDAATRSLLRSTFAPQPNVVVEIAPAPPPPTGPVLRPGDAALDTGWLADETAAYTLRLTEPMQMDVGTSTMTRTVAGGVVTEVSTVVVPQQNMNVTTTTTADAATLAPRSYVDTGGPSETTLAYTPSAASGTTTRAGAATPVAATLAAPVFDETMIGMVAQSLPFADGYTATAEVYSAERGVQAVTFTVSGPTGDVPAWTVVATPPSGPVTFTVDAATRRLVKMTMSPQPGVTVEMTPTP